MREKLGSCVGSYLETLFRVASEAECTGAAGERMTLDDACARVCNLCHDSHDGGGKIMFIGNGGSMGIAAHMAVDFSKNGSLRSMAFGDSAVLTCLSNDFGYHDVFARQIEWHGNALDVLMAISSSGESPNILKGARAAGLKGSRVVTFSGFREDNPLRRMGDVNFYVRAKEYGFVELAHQSLLHAMLDLDRGWKPNRQPQTPRVLRRVAHG
jgi:D-sedoheptulose 7-phosphate isomerase